MYKGSPFFVETQLGKLQLTKGAYLTLQKRKSSTLRTLAKTKNILKESNKPTVKRRTRTRTEIPNDQQVLMLNRLGETVSFGVEREHQRVKCRMLGSLPSIEMAYDNDAQSEWGEIEGCVTNLSLSLSLAAFDNHFQKE